MHVIFPTQKVMVDNPCEPTGSKWVKIHMRDRTFSDGKLIVTN